MASVPWAFGRSSAAAFQVWISLALARLLWHATTDAFTTLSRLRESHCILGRQWGSGLWSLQTSIMLHFTNYVNFHSNYCILWKLFRKKIEALYYTVHYYTLIDLGIANCNCFYKTLLFYCFLTHLRRKIYEHKYFVFLVLN